MSLRYQIALTSVPFDNTYQNVIRFNSREEQAEYFGLSSLFCKNAIDNGDCVNVNFDAGSLIRTSIFFISQETTAAGLLGKNYAIIRDTQEGAQPEYYYYFITDSRLNSSKQIQLDIELDIYQTYYQDITFGDCFINKAHINRFDENLHFDFTQDSNLYTREPIRDTPKRLVKREEIKPMIGKFLPTDEIDNKTARWIFHNVRNYLYVYLKPNADGFKFNDLETSAETTYTGNFYYGDETSSFNAPYQVLVFPIYEPVDNPADGGYLINFTNAIPITEASFNVDWSQTGFAGYINMNGTADIMAIKISPRPPFSIFWERIPSIIGNQIYIRANNKDTSGTAQFGNTRIVKFKINNLAGYSAAVVMETDDITHTGFYCYVDTGKKLKFSKSEITGNKNSDFNPKLLMSDTVDINVVINNESTSYDLTKIGTSTFWLNYSEAISPDITRIYLRYNKSATEDDEQGYGLYIDETLNSLQGLCASQDWGMPFAVNQLDTYLANNKNFYLQRGIMVDYARKGAAINLGFGLTDALVGGSFGLANNIKSPIGFAGASFGGINNSIKAGVNYDYTVEGIENRVIQSDLTLDNMRNAPEQATNINGNVFLTLAINKCMPYVEIYEALPRDLKAVDSQMNLYGYTYNQIDNVKNVDNIRKYFNYVSAELQTLQCTYGLSNEVMQMYRAIFSRGVRMWNNTDQLFKYEKENYENWLDEA